MSTDCDGRGQMRRGGLKAGADAKHRKKPYRSPKLVAYGDIRAITQAVGMSGNQDGGNPPNKKSQL